MKKFNIAIVGATGLVGQTFLKVMTEHKIEPENLYLYASSKSKGKVVEYMGKEYVVEDIAEAKFDNVDFALFSAGAGVSKEYAPKFVEGGATVIDNSKCWRMDPNCPLIVPEINIEDYKVGKLIANPNCSTIQSVVPLHYLNEEFGLTKVVYTTYQAVSGSGIKGLNDLRNTKEGKAPAFYPHDISKTCIPEIDVFMDNRYTFEEMKMINETHKILHNDIPVSATCIRVPVEFSHGVVMQAEFEKPVDVESAIKALEGKEGVVVCEDLANHYYPTMTEATGTDVVYVGRIRKDLAAENGLLLYCVADNVRKGAASNAVQIMLKLMGVYNA